MNTIRMFAFAAAVLMTALLCRVIADGLTGADPMPVATAADATRASAERPPSSAGY
jgi:hypothetical protein